MITEDLAICPECKHGQALTHYDTSGILNWIVCPKCRGYFEFEKKIALGLDIESETQFWKNVEQDTGFKNG